MSDYDAVNIFKKIKHEEGFDDRTAALLTLAETISRFQGLEIWLKDSGEGPEDKFGKDIARAIEDVTKDGAIQVNLDGELVNSVRGAVDVSGESVTGSAPKRSKTKNKK
jgi:hypothetical protein